MVLVEKLCRMHEERGLTDEMAPEVLRVIDAVLIGCTSYIESDGPVAAALKDTFGPDSIVWGHVQLLRVDMDH